MYEEVRGGRCEGWSFSRTSPVGVCDVEERIVLSVLLTRTFGKGGVLPELELELVCTVTVLVHLCRGIWVYLRG